MLIFFLNSFEVVTAMLWIIYEINYNRCFKNPSNFISFVTKYHLKLLNSKHFLTFLNSFIEKLTFNKEVIKWYLWSSPDQKSTSINWITSGG